MTDDKRPLRGQTWQHYNGARYHVLGVANLPDNPRYPETVIYMGDNGKVWARPLSDWHRSMTFLGSGRVDGNEAMLKEWGHE